MRSMLTLWLLKYILATRAHNKILSPKYGVTLTNTSSCFLTVRLKKRPSLCTLTLICKTMIPTICKCPATRLVIKENTISISSNSLRSGNLCECGRKQLNKRIAQRHHVHSTRSCSFFRTTLDLTYLSIVAKWLRCSPASNLLMFAKMVMSKRLLSSLPLKLSNAIKLKKILRTFLTNPVRI